MTRPPFLAHCLRIAVIIACMGGFGSVSAQPLTYGSRAQRPVQSLSFQYSAIDFAYRGDKSPSTTYDYAEPAFGAVYSRPNLSLAVLFGRANGAADSLDLGFLDASFSTWGAFRLTNEKSGFRPFIPVVLHSQYRRVSRGGVNIFQGEEDAFAVTSLGLGAGVGLSANPTKRMLIEARVTPILALATRSFGNTTGHSRILDADVQWHALSLAGRFGLTLGYAFRLQRWDVNGSDLFSDAIEDLFDYRGRQHHVRAGINW